MKRGNSTMDRLERIYIRIEHGKLFNILQGIFLLIIIAVVLISGIDFSDPVVYENTQTDVKRYIIKKVSRLPEKEAAEDTEEIKKEEDVLSIDDIRKRYIAYIVSKIEQHKIYPLKEQKMNHEGVVRFIIEITRKGKITTFSYVQRSRYAALNSATVQAVKNATPLAEFPAQLPEDSMRIHVKMNYFLE
jgi:TonB family protein